MKKLPLIVTALLTAVALLSACTGVPTESSSLPVASSSELSSSESGKAVPELIEQAMEVYSWFEICSLATVDITLGDDNSLRKVADNRFELYDDFVAYVRGIFSEEITASLFREDSEDRPYYNIDGYTYCRDFARGMDITVLKVDFDGGVEKDTELVYTATVSYGDPITEEIADTAQFDFVAEKTAAGWVFTEFPYFY